MCIIIHRPAGAPTRLSRETLQRCAQRNPHGFGIMWAYKGKLLTARYLPTQKGEFLKRALALQSQDLPIVLHFRWATHGAVTRDNTHPFVIEKGQSALMHNGILSIPCVKGWSDTRTFTNEVVRGLPPGWESVPTLRWMMEQATLGSKIAIMYADGRVTILHRNAGITEGGIWYSNDGFRPTMGSWEDEARKWAAKHSSKAGKSAKESAKVFLNTSTDSRPLPAGVLPFGRKVALGIQSSALYRFEGITICGWCLAREAGADDAVLVNEPHEGEQCELCYHSPLIPGSRKTVVHAGPDGYSMHPACEDEGRVCSGA